MKLPLLIEPLNSITWFIWKLKKGERKRTCRVLNGLAFRKFITKRKNFQIVSLFTFQENYQHNKFTKFEGEAKKHNVVVYNL